MEQNRILLLIHISTCPEKAYSKLKLGLIVGIGIKKTFLNQLNQLFVVQLRISFTITLHFAIKIKSLLLRCSFRVCI